MSYLERVFENVNETVDIANPLTLRNVTFPAGSTVNISGTADLVFPNPYGAQDYYVDGNASSSGVGTSWSTAFSTLAEAITASNASIALTANRWWARRNRIFVCGDQEIDEDLTVLPEKCDVIGVGSDLFPFPRIIGNHTIAAAAVSTRFINCGFIAEGAGDLFVIPAACHGLQFLYCFMIPATTSTKALEITSSAHVRLIGNTITVSGGTRDKIFAVAISIEGTSGHDAVISGNKIDATLGVYVASGLEAHGSRIEDNYIRATAQCIDDDSDDFQVINNRMISDAAATSTGVGVIDCNIQLAIGNRITCSDHLNAPFPIEGTLGG